MPAGKELVLFLRPLSQSCEPECLGQDLEMQDILGDCDCCQQSRFSVLSTDSGIERDLPAQEEPSAADPERSRLHRKGGIKKKPSPLDSVALLQPGSVVPPGKPPGKAPGGSGTPPEPAAPAQRLHTARVVLLGDDRVLGRLAQAFLSLRYLRLWGGRTACLLCPAGSGDGAGLSLPWGGLGPAALAPKVPRLSPAALLARVTHAEPSPLAVGSVNTQPGGAFPRAKGRSPAEKLFPSGFPGAGDGVGSPGSRAGGHQGHQKPL